MTLDLPALYPIVNIQGDAASEVDKKIALAVSLADAGATVIQLRAKRLSPRALLACARESIHRLASKNCRVIVNDRADVAVAAGAAGVHLGDEDLPPDAARALLGPHAIIGLSTHSLEDVGNAPTRLIDYIGFGPVFESPTKAGIRSARGTELLAGACRAARLPVVAIGGIDRSRAGNIFAAGAASCAVISELDREADLELLPAAYEELRRRSSGER